MELNKVMKILKVWPSWQEEIKYHDHYLADEMYKKGIETTFLVPDKMEKFLHNFVKQTHFPAGESYYNNSKVIRLKSIDLMNKFIPTELRKLYKTVNSGFDVIHIFGISNTITFMVLFSLLFNKQKPLVVINDHGHPDDDRKDLPSKIYYGVFKYLFKSFLPMIKKIYVPNTTTYNYLKKRYDVNGNNFEIIPLGYNSEIYNFKDNKNTDTRLIIGFAGKIEPLKKIEKLLKILKYFDKSEVLCIIVGISSKQLTDYQNNLIELSKKLDLQNIEFKPFLNTSKDLAIFYNYIDIAVFPGGISITTTEASGCGTPIILYNSMEGIEDRVEGQRGILFDTEEELREYISHYIELKKKKLIANEEIEKETHKYSWEELSEVYLKKYMDQMTADKKDL